MNRILPALTIAFVVLATSLQAQESLSTTRIEAQHKSTKSMGQHLEQHEQNLLKMLANENPTIQAQAVQAVRDLEQMFPQYTFKWMLVPLETKLKDETADRIVRRLAALALDELHSDAGDAIIRDVSISSEDKGLQTLCSALLVRSDYK
jgi:hypothetical protein